MLVYSFANENSLKFGRHPHPHIGTGPSDLGPNVRHSILMLVNVRAIQREFERKTRA